MHEETDTNEIEAVDDDGAIRERKRNTFEKLCESLVDLEISLSNHGLSLAAVIRDHVKRAHGITI